MGQIFWKGQNFSTGQNFYLAFKFAQTPRDYYPPYGLSCLKTDFWYLSFYLLTAYFFIWYPLPQISAIGGPIDTKFFVRTWGPARSKTAYFDPNPKTGSARKKFGHFGKIEKIDPLKINGESLWLAKNKLE